jgi:hypothetical protein
MKERTFTLTNGAQLATVIVVALLLALAALLLNTEPAEAVDSIYDGAGPHTGDAAPPYVTSTYPANNTTRIAAGTEFYYD